MGQVLATLESGNFNLSLEDGGSLPAAALSILGSNFGSSERCDGNIFEVIVWDTMQDNAQVYAYQHEVTGL